MDCHSGEGLAAAAEKPPRAGSDAAYIRLPQNTAASELCICLVKLFRLKITLTAKLGDHNQKHPSWV